MSPSLAAVLALLAAAVVMFACERPRMDVVALLMLTLLPFTGVVTIAEATSGFADQNVVLIATLFVIGEGLVRTGVAARLGDHLLARAAGSGLRMHVLLMSAVAALGAVMSSTAVVVIFIPVALRLARSTGTPAGRLMMPLSVAALASGMLTLVATPPNLVVNSELARQGIQAFGFFSVTPIGLPILLVSVAYMWVARRWLHVRTAPAPMPVHPQLADWVDRYELAGRTHRLRISFGSPAVGRTVEALNFRRDHGANILAIERAQGSGAELVTPGPETELRAGDVLLVELVGPRADVHALAERYALDAVPLSGVVLGQRAQDIGLAELMVSPESALVGRTLADTQFRTRHRLTALALRRGRAAVSCLIQHEPLRAGDTLLVIGRWKHIEALVQESDELVLLGGPAGDDHSPPAPGRARYAVGVLALVVVLMVSGVVPFVHAGLVGALLMGAFRCVDLPSAYASIHWKSLIVIVGMMPFSLALQRTGVATAAADALVAGAGDGRLLLAGLFVATSLLGLFVSNTATAVLMAPIAVAVAAGVGASPRPFAMVVAIAASAAFLTPVSSPVNMLVVEPGGYTFGDFVKVGLPLTVLVLVAAVTLVPVFFPF